PQLISPTRGRYTITRDQEPIGEETFTITSSGGIWRAQGRLAIRWPVDRIQGYVLEIDQETREPIAFEAWMELLGERQSVRAQRDAAYFHFEMRTLRGERKRDVPYAPGTVLDFASPLFNTLALSL